MIAAIDPKRLLVE